MMHTIEQLQHALTISHMANRLAECFNQRESVSGKQILALFDSFNWTDPLNGVVHSARTPLSVEFIFPLYRTGRVRLSNLRPAYISNLLPGEYRLRRTPHDVYQEQHEQLVA